MSIERHGMPFPQGLGGGLRRPPVSVVFLESTEVINGRVFATVYEPISMRKWRKLPVLSRGGSAEHFAHEPLIVRDPDPRLPPVTDGPIPTEDRAVQVLLLHRDRQVPYVLGTIQHPKQDIVDAAPGIDPDADHPGDIGRRDFAWRQGDARIILDERGAVTLLGSGDDGNVRVQVDNGSIIRLSRDGNASERVAIAGPLVTWATELQAFNTELELRVRGLEAAVSVMATAFTASVGVPVIGEVVFAPGVGDQSAPELGAIRSSVVHVSEEAE